MRRAELAAWADNWAWETNPNFQRQRPAILIVLRPDGLPFTVPTTLGCAHGLAHASWDVKLLLHLTGRERDDLAALKAVRAEIDEINKGITRRNEEEKGKLPDGVAPLCPLGAPLTFRSAKELETAVEHWLTRSFIGVQQVRSVWRPPFGVISFSGHGKSVIIDDAKPRGKSNASLQFMVTGTEWFDLSRLEALVLRKYQAPVWVMTDLCRIEKPGSKADDGDIGGKPEKLKPREFENLAALSDADRRAVVACEALRAGATAGSLHRNGLGVTTLNATHRLLTFRHEPKRLLHGYYKDLLAREEARDGTARARFKNWPENTTSVTLAQAQSWVAGKFVHNGVDAAEQKPELLWGTLSGRVVVFSTLRGKDAYQPQYPNLLDVGVSAVPLPNGSFTVPQLSGGEHAGAVSLTRTQKEFNSDFTSVFQFQKPFDLVPGVKYQLALLVSASSPDGKDAIKFTTGVYDTTGQLLNPSFQDYGTAESYSPGIKCDGEPRLVHVPLTWFNSPDADPKPDAPPRPEVARFEVQAAPNNPKANWSLNATLTVHAVHLLPLALPDEQLKADIERAKAPLSQMLIWDVPLHAHPEAVTTVDVGEADTVLKQSRPGHTGAWGAAGALYPKVYVDAGKQQLRLKLAVADDTKIDEAAEACVYVCSNTRVMATWKAPLKRAVAQEHLIPVTDSGLIQEVVVVVRNHSDWLKITKLDIENAPAKK